MVRRVRVEKYLFRAANVWWRLCSILLLPLVARCLETIDVCIWRMFVLMTVWGLWEVCCVVVVFKDSVFLAFKCCMFVSCVHHVAGLNAAFCMACSLLMLVEEATIWKRYTP